jgi:4-hydroxyacetophenone monooxygenase
MERNYYVNQRHNRLQVNAPWYSPDFHRMCTEIDWGDLRLD